jgi:GNAT superfamily N-acetyltransferase
MNTIEKLSNSTLDLAIQLRNRTFKGLSNCEKETLEASLDIDNEKYKKCLNENKISYLEYFVMIEEKTNKVIGLTGIYVEDKEEECWLGWFCVDENYRGQGLGQKLLDFSINRAKELNKNVLKLYTYDSKEYQPAINLYEKNCFKNIGEENKDIYYQLILSQPPVRTKHRYIKKYPIKKDDKYLILGTIHPHSPSELDFFYGNTQNFWEILSEVFGEKLDGLDSILEFLNKHHIAISDMILECCRDNEKVTADEKLYNLVLNESIKDDILNSNIETIFFTSGDGPNGTAKLFFDLFELNDQWPKDWRGNREFDILLGDKTTQIAS